MVAGPQIQAVLIGFLLFATTGSLSAQSLDTPMTRMRPIGSPSAVDQFRRSAPAPATALHETGYQSPVQQTVMLQQGGLTSPALPPNPPSFSNNGNALPMPGSAQPSNSGTSPQLPAVGSDLRPVPQPQLQTSFATVDNCNLITPASAYSAAFSQGCGTNGYVVPQTYAGTQAIGTPLTYAPPPSEIAVPAILPGSAPGARAGAPMRSVITLGQERFQVNVGQGLWGQPVAYVPGQPLRNWVRYFFP